MVLAQYGTGSYSARFYFKWKRQLASVIFRCDNQAGFARLLRMWRLARRVIYKDYTKRCWNGIRVPMIEKRRLDIQRFSLRWLACRPCVLVTHNPKHGMLNYKLHFYSTASYERKFCRKGDELKALGF